MELKDVEEVPDYIPKNKLFSELFGFHKEHFICLIVGCKGSGKTQLTTKILRNSGVDFDQLFILSPTADQPKYQYLYHGLNNRLSNEEINFLSQDENSYFISPETKIKKIIDNKIIQPLEKTLSCEFPRRCHILKKAEDIDNLALENSLLSKYSKNIFIFDDILGLKNNEMKKISTYVTHGRHFNCSVILLTQDYSEILPTIKKNTDIFIFFQPFQACDRQYFFRYYFQNNFENYKSFNEYLNSNLKQKFDFVVITPTAYEHKIITRTALEEILNKF